MRRPAEISEDIVLNIRESSSYSFCVEKLDRTAHLTELREIVAKNFFNKNYVSEMLSSV